MQTFAPFDDVERSLAVLDGARLGKQILEASILLECVLDGTGRYAGHCVTKSWEGCCLSLSLYGTAAAKEDYRRRQRPWETWQDRDAPHRSLISHFDRVQQLCAIGRIKPEMPCWWGMRKIHESHRGHLFRKNPAKYEQFEPWKDVLLLYPVVKNGKVTLVERIEFPKKNMFRKLDGSGVLFRTVWEAGAS